MSADEWNYLFTSRTKADSLYGSAMINGIYGLILLPDDWENINEINFYSGIQELSNMYTSEQWALLESNGAIFLPAAGWRQGTDIADGQQGNGGHYWTTSRTGIVGRVVNLSFYYGSYLSPSQNTDIDDLSNRGIGYSVRLVQDM